MNTVELILAVLVLSLIITAFIQQCIIDGIKSKILDISNSIMKINNSRNIHPIHRSHSNPIPHENGKNI